MAKAFDLSVAEALCDALVGYLTLQARARMYEVYSEYLLYDTIARIAHGRGWYLECEVPVSPLSPKGRGDHRRIDFLLRRNRKARACVLIEVKYSPSPSRIAKVGLDVEKLQGELSVRGQATSALLLVVGAKTRKNAGFPFPVEPSIAATPLYDVCFPARHTCFGATAWRIPRGGR